MCLKVFLDILEAFIVTKQLFIDIGVFNFLYLKCPGNEIMISLMFD